MILRTIFENRSAGFFVDVGAHHPKRFSNTYFFTKEAEVVQNLTQWQVV